MAVENTLQKHSRTTAAANYSSTAGLAGPNGSGQFLIVKYTGTGTAPTSTVASAGTDRVAGILQNDPIAGQPCDVAYGGDSKVVAGAAFAIGVGLMSDANGCAVTQTGVNNFIGYALAQATAQYQVVEVQISPAYLTNA